MSIVVNNWRMDSSLNALIHCETGETRRLGEYHFILLEILAKNADTVMSRAFLMSEVWKNRVVGGNSLPTAIHALRVAIDDDGKQQEIIKTVPKKGYLFNKSYLTFVEDAVENAPPEEAPLPVVETSAPAPALPEPESVITQSAPPASHRRRNALLALCALACVAGSVFFALPRFTSQAAVDVPQLVKENVKDASRIALFHFYHSPAEQAQPSTFSRHISPALHQVNALLATHNATMDLYYKASLQKLSLDILLNSSCDKSTQLALNFSNWQNKDKELNAIMFQEVEKMLNEMPSC